MIALTILASAIVSRAVDERRHATDGELALFLAIVIATTMARPSQLALLALLPAMSGWRQSPMETQGRTARLDVGSNRTLDRAASLVAHAADPPEWNVADQFRIIVTKPGRCRSHCSAVSLTTGSICG
jgi:hypothetical protein